jgi:ubiquinone/menaquinone biosynthesis C-methylase UbiE
MDTKEAKMTKEIYTKQAELEWKRLVQDPYHKLEFNTTMRFLKEYLPKKGLILDAGGGPGRYTIELAKRGYEVVLLDITPGLLELAKKQIKKAGVENKVKELVEDSIINMSRFPSGSFDAVICLGGPLSHIAPEKNRKKAISELIRVAKKNSPIFISVMGKFGVLLATPDGWPQEANLKRHFNELALKGDDYLWWGGGYCHFFTLAEFEGLLPTNQVKILQRIGLEGLNASGEITNKFAKKFPKAWKNWVDVHNKLCTHPTVVDASGHMMIIVKKK